MPRKKPATILIGGKALKTKGPSSSQKAAAATATATVEPPLLPVLPPGRKREYSKRGTGPSQYAKVVAKVQARFAADEHSQDLRISLRDIGEPQPFGNFKLLDLENINWERRLACKKDPLLDLETYFPKVFYLGWADYQRSLIAEIEDRIKYGGKKAFGCPRGGGKTAIIRGMILRATKYAFRNFAFFVGSKEDKAIQTLEFIKAFWYRSPLLRQDFPEIAYPVYRIEGRSTGGVHGQIFHGERTHIIWAGKELQYPCLLFTREEVEPYLKNDPDCVRYVEEMDKYVIKSAGCIIRVAGIDGSIRGEADIHPVLLTQPRPDLVLLDDVQKDQKADSPKSCEDLERLIESAIDYLSAPDIQQGCLMPCTVIREGDVADTYLDRMKKPEWSGERNGIITKYPDGIDDNVILDEINGAPNPQGALWLEYKETREHSYRVYGDNRQGNAFYKEHQAEMDVGFEISWSERYKHDSEDLCKNEISAVQSAMNWRFKDQTSFLSEGQNRPRSRLGDASLLLTPAEIAEHITNIPRNEVSAQWTNLVCFIDVQDELLFYGILAHDHNFNGQFIDYGTFPQTTNTYFRKSQTAGWSMLTRLYYKENWNERPSTNLNQNRSLHVRAPFDAKIYLALKSCCSWLLSRKFPMHDQNQTEVGIRAIGIDTKWGKSSDVVKRFVREFNDQRLICYQGHPFYPSNRQLEEYTAKPGELYEHQQFPHIRESTWVIKPYVSGGRYILADVSRLKSNLMKRFATQSGAEGCITLFASPPEKHRMFADEVAGSQYPEAITSRGITKDCWQSRPDRKDDDDYLDVAAGCLCLASICGASIKTTDKPFKRRQRSLQDAYRQRQKVS